MTNAAPKLLTDEEFVDRLVRAGYSKAEAVSMVLQDLAEAEEEDGYDGP